MQLHSSKIYLLNAQKINLSNKKPKNGKLLGKMWGK